MASNDNLIQSRVSATAKDALLREAKAAGITVSLLVRQILTRDLRARWVIDDARVR